MTRHDDDFPIASLVDEALFIECIPAKESGNLAFLARILVLATMPHSKTDEMVWERRNGRFKLRMVADPEYGLPYGAQARLILAWVTSRAIKTQCPVIDLGPSLSGFMRSLGIPATGGKRGTIAGFKRHCQRLFTSTIAFTYDDDDTWVDRRYTLAEAAQLWWQSPSDGQASKVCLSAGFYEELVRHPVPFDFRALAALRKSPLAMDIYLWLTYRYSTLAAPLVIPWSGLMMQFGASYASERDFRRKFLRQLRRVQTVYPRANVAEVPSRGLKLWPSPTHVARIH